MEIDGEEEDTIIDTDMLNLLEIFITSFNLLHEVNEYFNILDYKKFYNDSLSKHLNIKREFRTYLHNERVKERQRKEKEKKDKDKDKDIAKMEEEKEEDDDYFLDKSNKIKFTLFDYMWLFNPSAKNDIIFLFNENGFRIFKFIFK